METPFPVERIFGGKMLGARGQNFLVFYDWQSGDVVRKIDVTPTVVPRGRRNAERGVERGGLAGGDRDGGRVLRAGGSRDGGGDGVRAAARAGRRGGERVLGGGVLPLHHREGTEVLRGRRGDRGQTSPAARLPARISRQRQRRRPRRQRRALPLSINAHL